jgi:hypothetical protein
MLVHKSTLTGVVTGGGVGANAQSLSIRLWLNGIPRQDGQSSNTVDGTEIDADGAMEAGDQSWVWSSSFEESPTGSWQLSDNSSEAIGDRDNAFDVEGDSGWDDAEESKESEHTHTIDMDSGIDGLIDDHGVGDGNGSGGWSAQDEDDDRFDGATDDVEGGFSGDVAVVVDGDDVVNDDDSDVDVDGLFSEES